MSELEQVLERISSKQRRLSALRPLPSEFVQSLEHKLRVELTYASNAIEGNTLTLRETQLLIDEGITPASGKKLREIHEAINHNEAVKLVYRLAELKHPVSEREIMDMHALVLKNIDDNWAGRYRGTRVFVVGSPLIPPGHHHVPQLMAEFIEWLSKASDHPARMAADAHYKFAKIHPFVDGNGRTARLLMNLILLKNDYPLAVIPADERAEYIGSMDEADRGNITPFYLVVFRAIEKSLDLYLSADEK
jgi:Fic family protein